MKCLFFRVWDLILLYMLRIDQSKALLMTWRLLVPGMTSYTNSWPSIQGSSAGIEMSSRTIRWSSASSPSNAKQQHMLNHVVQKMPSESGPSISNHSSAIIRGRPRVFCMNKVAELFMSDMCLFGVRCFCHALSMSVKEFCEHSGSPSANPGEAVHLENGMTVAQWRHLFFGALLHACVACSLRPSVEWIAVSNLEDESAKVTPEAHALAWKTLKSCSCILVPGGFGDRGVQGMILAAKFARENKIPYLGICLGMQISVIEYSRSVLGLEKANSEEFDPEAPYSVIIFMPEGSRTHMGSTMRLGSRRTFLRDSDFITSKLYQKSSFVDERHRHRYEVPSEWIDQFASGIQTIAVIQAGHGLLQLGSCKIVCTPKK